MSKLRWITLLGCLVTTLAVAYFVPIRGNSLQYTFSNWNTKDASIARRGAEIYNKNQTAEERSLPKIIKILMPITFITLILFVYFGFKKYASG